MAKKEIMLLKPECITPGLNVMVDWYGDQRQMLRGVVKRKLRKNYSVEVQFEYPYQKKLCSVPYDRLTINTGFTKEGRMLMDTKEDKKYFWGEEHINWCSSLLKVMQLPGTKMDKEAKDLMGEYAKKPDNYLKDVNEMLSFLNKPISEEKKKL